MSSHITRIFENSDVDSESESDYEDEFIHESDYEDTTEEVNENSEEDNSDDENTEEKKQKNKKISNEIYREKAIQILISKFEKYNTVGVKKRLEKAKEIENIIFEQGKKNNDYNIILRSVITNCSNLNYNQMKEMIGNYFDNPIFKKCKEMDTKNLNNITCRLEPMSGIHKCRCGCDKVYSYELQTRSADEGMTLFLQCYECGKKWRN
jgi:DNA-directed RNA polymerase subunit M/transcription elongation factor TFIIS